MRRRAFALGETLLAFTIISLVLILLLNLFPSSLATVRRSEIRFQALTLADNTLEQQVARPFADLIVATSTQQAVGDFQVQTQVLTIAGEDSAWLKNVRVTVRWRDRDQPRQLIRELRVHRLAHQL